MRLRRETGDFDFTLNSDSATQSISGTIPAGLTVEQLVGQVVKITSSNGNYGYSVVSMAAVGAGEIVLKVGEDTLSYNPETGAVTSEG